MDANPVVVVDTREQAPLKIREYPTIVEGLPVGDYGIAGFSDWNNPRFIIERKSFSDLLGSLTRGRKRFMREIEKMRRFQVRGLLIEGSLLQISQEFDSHPFLPLKIPSLGILSTRRYLQLLRYIGFEGIIIDSAGNIEMPPETRSSANPKSVLASLDAIQVRAGVQVYWCNDSEGAARRLEGLVRQFTRGVLKDIKRLQKAEQGVRQRA